MRRGIRWGTLGCDGWGARLRGVYQFKRLRGLMLRWWLVRWVYGVLATVGLARLVLNPRYIRTEGKGWHWSHYDHNWKRVGYDADYWAARRAAKDFVR
jgi:hypothetical protein